MTCRLVPVGNDKDGKPAPCDRIHAFQPVHLTRDARLAVGPPNRRRCASIALGGRVCNMQGAATGVLCRQHITCYPSSSSRETRLVFSDTGASTSITRLVLSFLYRTSASQPQLHERQYHAQQCAI
ncbi:hypothetical protein EXIGLDRAFT_338727 [Exidia glandulosa HHB12029]|uniref:Uncharacterized protein n=1 Tax=Exidia glandulosa HHB12029 TaxID=1314781 RepID=A0A165CK49_EXIGL|nr:hypothetical protein EXIGLDRAFT_338727 [Exidia glandulosa HHB12029]